MRLQERMTNLCIECCRQVSNLKKEFANTVGEKLALPPETLGEVPLVQLHGRRRVSIENHRGILAYTDSEVRVCVKRGSVLVEGSGMSIVRMTRRYVEISGSIRSVTME